MIADAETKTATQSVQATELEISGMTCNNCARHVREAIESVPAVAGASVELEAGRATVRWKNGPDLGAVRDAVKAAGYEAHSMEAGHQHHAGAKTWSPLTGWRFNVVVGLACTLPLMVGEWVFGWGTEAWFHWFGLALALPVQIFCGARFYAGAWRQLKSGQSNMDTLVALGSTTAFGYSLWGLFTGQAHLYFMESAAIITLISVGHWMESLTSARAESSLQALMKLAPRTARRRGANGSETEVPVGNLQLGDVVVLKPGDQVPVDAEVIEGGSSVDEAMLTGESLPVDKARGDKIYAGTMNLDGRMEARVTATGEATALAHIIAAVERAQNSRAEIQRLGDRVSNVFVPVVITIALATALWWGLAWEQASRVSEWLAHHLWHVPLPPGAWSAAIICAAAVLIIACPCAMGLATPIAIMAGTNAAARRGILIRDGIALERAGKITAIVLDKTGTLTSGELAFAGPWTPDGSKSAVSLAYNLVASLARRSNHPISKALAKVSGESLQLENWQEIAGAGVQALWHTETGERKTVRLGSLSWLRELKIGVPENEPLVEKWKNEGATVVGVAVENDVIGMFALRDFLKPGAAAVVRQLQQQGLKTFLLTGDNPKVAAYIAREVGIPEENVFSEVRPERKAEFIAELHKRGERVAFVGDGINDAPALEAADLGIAVSRASDVAREAADIILLKSEIRAVPEALQLARATLRTIKQNLFWAFFYNAAGIPLAAVGLMSPILCALAMGMSDLVVIGNALRLLRHGAVPKS